MKSQEQVPSFWLEPLQCVRMKDSYRAGEGLDRDEEGGLC